MQNYLYNKLDIYKNNLNKKCILFGTGSSAINFYKRFPALDIVQCFDNRINADFDGFEVTLPYAHKKSFNYLIIICSEYEVEISEQLIDLGYKPFEDFINARWYDFIATVNRKIAFFYGTCHVNAIFNACKNISPFCDEYDCVHIRVNSIFILDRIMALDLIENCDVLIYEQYFNNPVDKKDIRGLKIGIPEIWFMAYWPQLDKKRTSLLNVKFGAGTLMKRFGDSITNNFDCFINKLIIDGNYTDEEIIKIIQEDNAINMQRITDVKEKCFRTMKVSDSLADIKVSEWIQDNYKRIRVFRESQHLGEDIIKVYSVEIMKRIYGTDTKIIYDNLKIPYYPTNEMPIYPCVKKALELDDNVSSMDTKYAVNKIDGSFEWLSFEEYEREYIYRCRLLLSENA